jgi:thiamine biosynthesis protein ThiS
MQVTVNGEPRAIPDGTTAAQLLELLKVTPERVVVEVNLTILKRAQLVATALREGDRVEIVHFVGGGSGPGWRVSVLTDAPPIR